MTLLGFIVFFVAFVISAICCSLVLRYARRRNLFDHPNERSLHNAPVPRGGGAAIVFSTTVCMTALIFFGSFPPTVLALWILCGLCVGLLGWIDDHRNVRVSTRFFVQWLVAIFFIAGLLLAPGVAVPAWVVEHHLLVILVGAFGTVWLINLTNFMDGSDGYAGTEALMVAGIGGMIVGKFGGHWTYLAGLCIGGSAAGFLLWNWCPAKIFMGDVGSYFLGFQFAAIIAVSIVNGSGPWTWLILLIPFVVDASLTLMARIVGGQKWWTAHRSHLYQRMILAGHSHQVVAIGLSTLTLFVLTPVALVVAANPETALSITAIAYALAAMIWLVLSKKFVRRDH
jgi:Fuc2NAc and GlcNAc transferase